MTAAARPEAGRGVAAAGSRLLLEGLGIYDCDAAPVAAAPHPAAAEAAAAEAAAASPRAAATAWLGSSASSSLSTNSCNPPYTLTGTALTTGVPTWLLRRLPAAGYLACQVSSSLLRATLQFWLLGCSRV